MDELAASSIVNSVFWNSLGKEELRREREKRPVVVYGLREFGDSFRLCIMGTGAKRLADSGIGSHVGSA